MKVDVKLVDFIQSQTEEDMAKGYGLFADREEEVKLVTKKQNQYFFLVPGKGKNKSWPVSLNVGPAKVVDDCGCKEYERYAQCEHTVTAALFLLVTEFGYSYEDLEELIEDDFDDMFDMFDIDDMPGYFSRGKSQPKREPAKKVSANDNKAALTVAGSEWKSFVHAGTMGQNVLYAYTGYYWFTHNDIYKVVQSGFDEKTLHWTFSYKDKKQSYLPEIKYDGRDTYSYRCTCLNKTRNPMCQHVFLAFIKLTNLKGGNCFLQFKDWAKEKNNLLQPYGLTVADDDAKAFQFSVSYNGQLEMKAPAAYIREGDKEHLKKISLLLKAGSDNGPAGVARPKLLPNTIIDFETGFVFNANSQRLKIGFELEVAKVYRKPGKTDVKKLSLNNPQNLPLLNELSNDMYGLVMQLTDNGLLDYLQTKGMDYFRNYSNPWQQLAGQTVPVLQKHYISCLYKLWPYLAEHPFVFLLKEGKFSSANCRPVSASAEGVELSFAVTADERFITIRLVPLLNKVPVTGDYGILHQFVFHIQDSLHLLKQIEDLKVMEQFATGFIKVPVSAKYETIQNIIIPLQERYAVQLAADFQVKTIQLQPQPQLLLKEYNEQYLMLQPQFMYDDVEVDFSRHPEDILNILPDGSLQITKRDTALEKQFYESLRPLHPSFDRQRQNDFYYVHFNEVMKGAWFLNTVRYLQEANITVKGMQQLKRFRYNTHSPKWEMKAGSGIDWFDLQVKISFGEQEVSLKEVRKAILTKQNIVVLGDGTFGVLPEDWLQQYGLLLKMGEEQKDGALRVSKLHFTIIDELHNQIDNDAILQEIEEKKQKLRNIENIQTAALSKQIKAKLRPYQLSGFQWLQTLDSLGWGGCLADDMGLGKTLQTITFLQYLKEKYKTGTHLVVCPTSLIYNWEAELQKFAPKLKYHIYYGSSRTITDEHFEQYDVVITSYGLVRMDMEQLLRFEWHYVILDESQAIKNPDAQTTRAVQLLKCKNRLILSGTPVQNNTFDLFAQFNFLNPGLLGNKEFFKTEFANPVDKHNDAEKSRQLRQLVYPFLLRRTKQQVARDLPDKTETILWCQLPKEQRAVYEDYKQYYRAMLLKKIEEEGMAKAGIYVLEGLLRLRQICNSPQLLNDADVTTTQSIKTEELLREIEENTGEHKLLVFSQFTEMLHLVESALKQRGITYCYLDGSTNAKKRKERIETFQTDEKVKVFLISLKAGGVGLNLTAADYVYLIDPWWNPAVEQQAIDRTHRIGQAKKIFAYKMICKDTVEEKILQLQQRKKQLANELVTEDAGFMKKLTKDDVAFLFS